jgi:hypothetical protein
MVRVFPTDEDMKQFATAIVIGLYYFLPAIARAECGAVTIEDLKHGADLIFEGTVTNVDRLETGERASTMKVDRVWKGTVHEMVTVYYTRSLDGPYLEEGVRRVVFAHRQKANGPRTYDMVPDGPLRNAWVFQCGGTAGAMATVRAQLGRSHKPSK